MAKFIQVGDTDEWEDASEAIQTMGVPLGEVANHGREVFFRALKKPISPQTPDKQAKWENAAAIICSFCDNREEVGWRDLARKAHDHYHRMGEGDESSWSDQPPVMQFAWEAVARAMVNMRMAEDSNDVDRANAFNWNEWLRKKLE